MPFINNKIRPVNSFELICDGCKAVIEKFAAEK